MPNFLAELGLTIFVSTVSSIFAGLFGWEEFRRWYYRPRLDAVIVNEESNGPYETSLTVGECELLMILKNEGRSRAENVRFCGYFPEDWKLLKLEADEMTLHPNDKKPLISKINEILKKETGLGDYFELRGSLSHYYYEPIGFILKIPEKHKGKEIKFQMSLRSDNSPEKDIRLSIKVW